jgi:hypothetical protein
MFKEPSLILAKYKNEIDEINFYLKRKIIQQFSEDQLLIVFQNFKFLADKFKKVDRKCEDDSVLKLKWTAKS